MRIGNKQLAIAMSLLLLILGWPPPVGRASPCSPDIVTVHGTSRTEFVNDELLGQIGFQAVVNGTLEFTYSYRLGVEVGPGSYTVKSFDAGGTLLDTIDLTPTTVFARVHERVGVQPFDEYIGAAGSEANGVEFQFLLYLVDRTDLDALPRPPLEYLNDLSLWSNHTFGVGVQTPASYPDLDYGTISHTVTSLSATITPGPECGVVLADLITRLPDGSFSAGGHRAAFLSRLAEIEQNIQDGDLAAATQQLKNLRRRVDGCGIAADQNDWIVDCRAQQQVRALIDAILLKLGG